MPLPEIDEILLKYKCEENKIEALLDQIKTKNQELSTKRRVESNTSKLCYEEAKARNEKFLKDLENIKGNLRSKSIFSPTELQWEKICQRYQQEPALPIKTWRCNLPVFV